MRNSVGSRFKVFLTACTAVLALSLSTAMAATVHSFVDLESATMPSQWKIGAQAGGSVSISKDRSLNYAGSAGSLRGTYPVATGNVYVWAEYNVAHLNTRDIYIEFWAKMPGAKRGLKFVKVFGAASGGGAANTTFGLDYTGIDPGSMYQVSFGDGSTNNNDTQNVINFDGTNPNWIGRSYGKASVRTPQGRPWRSSDWGTGWHHFRIRCKFNSGTSASNEVADGAYYVEIDGKVYVDAQGIFNRHYSNGPIDRVELFGWSQNGSTPFEIWYDNIKITTNGFDSGSTSTPTSPAPKPPASLSVQ